MDFVYISIYFLIKSVIGLRIYELTEENPSFAIHGYQLAIDKKIILTGCEGCDYLIDFSRRDCLHLEPIKAGQRKGPDNIFCYDPLPILINEQELDIHDCPGILPYDKNFTKCLYSCNYELKNVNELQVRLLDNVESLEFAISFRITKWVDGDKRVLVIPSTPNPDPLMPETSLLIRPNTLAILVRDPVDIEKGDNDGPKIQAMIIARSSVTYYNYKPDIDCPTFITYFAYPGSAPGKRANASGYLIDFDMSRHIQLHTTVATFYTNESCTFVLQANFRSVDPIIFLDEGLFLDSKLPVNSFGFPWTFDDSNRYTQCQNSKYQVGDVFTPSILLNIHIINQKNGRLELVAHPKNDPVVNPKAHSCDETTILWEYSSNQDVMDLDLQIDCYCIMINWCPSNDSDSSPRGFFLILQKDSNEISDDATVLTPILDGPPLILNFQDLSEIIEATPIWIAFEDDCEDCEFLVDITRGCNPISKVENCSSFFPIYVDEKAFVPDSCEINYRAYTKEFIQRCRYQRNTRFSLFYRDQIQTGANLGKDVLSIRVINSRNRSSEAYDYQLEMIGTRTEVLPKPLAFQVEISTKPTWIAVCYQHELDIYFLDKLRSDRGVSKCEYLLLEGPPPGNTDYDDRIRMRFNDADRFVGQFVEGSIFSVLVPPGCTPSFRLDSGQAPEMVPTNYQQVCEGIITIATRTKLCQYESTNCFYLFREVFVECTSFLIDAIVEVSWMRLGELTIQFIDDQYEWITNSTIHLNKFNGKPQNFTISQVRGIHVRWDNDFFFSTKIFGGFFGRIYVTKPKLFELE